MFRVVLGLLLVATAAAQPPAPIVPKWSYDEIVLTNGAKLQGLILSETAIEVRFQSIRRPPGKPTFTLTSKVPRSEIASVRPLSEADRGMLKERLAELDQDGSG